MFVNRVLLSPIRENIKYPKGLPGILSDGICPDHAGSLLYYSLIADPEPPCPSYSANLMITQWELRASSLLERDLRSFT